jgi:hypothetical protein
MDRFPPQKECNRCGAIIGVFGGCDCEDDYDPLEEAQKEEDTRSVE